MNRKVSVCTLCAQSAQGAADYLEQRLREYTAEITAADFGDAASFAAGVGSCASQGGIILAAAPLSLFLNAKLRLLKLMSSKIVRSSAIIAAMGENIPANQKEADFQSALPEKSKAFVSGDGLFSPFAKEFGESLVIYLPLDENRLAEAFSGELGNMLGSMLSAQTVTVPQKNEKPRLSVLKEHVGKVIDSGKTVAVSPCGSAKALLSVITTVPGCENSFIPDSAIRDKLPDESDEDYVAQCAKISKENSSADLGISISSVYNDGGEDFVMVCVADSERAKAAKVYAEPGEERKHLIAAALIQLCGMLDELSGPEGLVNPNSPAKAEKKRSKNSKLPIIIAIIGIAAAFVICLILAFVLGRENSSTSLDSAGQYGVIQEEANTLGSYENIYDYGGSALEPFDMEAVALSPVTTSAVTSESSVQNLLTVTSTTKLTTTQKITQVLTTIKKTTTKATTTTTRPVTTTATTKKATTTTTSTTSTTAATTTQKAETTTLTTANNAANSSTTLGSNGSKGTFIFRVYGWGHGVGMSQDGAIQMAKNGSNYEQILTHYFIGTTVKTDSNPPANNVIKYAGKEIPLVEYLCRATKPEIGASAPTEALKAQIVAIYTYAKWYNFDVDKSRHAYDDDYNYIGTNLHKACLEVLGMSSDTDTPVPKYVDYNGGPAFTCYFATAAGKTASSDSVWGGGSSKYPYLAGGAESPEDPETSTVEISAEDMKKLIEAYGKDNDIKITLGENPAEWLEIVEHDSSYSENIGYVTTIRVGDYTMKGNTFRSYVADFKLRSHCFTIEYVPA